MFISIFEIFKIGIGPSSSHTMGPMKAAHRFVSQLNFQSGFTNTSRITAELFGSLALTGKGHGTDKAIQLGLLGETAENIESSLIQEKIDQINKTQKIDLFKTKIIHFDPKTDLIFHYDKTLNFHPNGMKFSAFNSQQEKIAEETFYSIGGGFILSEDEINDLKKTTPLTDKIPFPFENGSELLTIGKKENLKIWEIILANESSKQSKSSIESKIDQIWYVMKRCVERGCNSPGNLPGGLRVRRRANELFKDLCNRPEASLKDPLTILDWVNLYALAVNEENASFGQVVTAPTNGAAGIIPAVLHYYDRFVPHSDKQGIYRYLLTAAAIGMLYKKNASISGAEVGCQGEVGVASSMAAAALTEVLGGTNEQIENAAEIAMEHHLGMTCDPVGGLVQIPCIERNAMGAVKAINAARMALRGNGEHYISLDQVIETMKQTGLDMSSKYKETSRGGLAVNIPEC